MKFWQWSLLNSISDSWFSLNLLDKKKSNIKFTYKGMPHIKPIPIKTKGKGFWKGIAMWLLSTRNWELVQDWKYNLNGTEYVIPKGFQFDGASIPKFLRTFFSPVGVLLMVDLYTTICTSTQLVNQSNQKVHF